MAKVSGEDGKVIVGTGTGTITNATGTTTIVVVNNTIVNVGDRILIEDVVGMTDINGEHTITAIDAGVSFSILIPTTAQTYVSGGSAILCVSITGWSLDLASEVINTTDSSNSTWNAFISNDWTGGTGTFEGFFEGGVTDLVIGDSYPLVLRLSGAIYYTGTGIITGNSTTVDVPGTEAVKKSYTFTVTDSETLTTA